MDVSTKWGARNWALDLVDTVADARGWSDAHREEAEDLVKGSFWGAFGDSSAEMLKALAEDWPEGSGYPEGWDKLESVWLAAAEVAAGGYSDFDAFADAASGTASDAVELLEEFGDTAEAVVGAAKNAAEIAEQAAEAAGNAGKENPEVSLGIVAVVVGGIVALAVLLA